jgi:hypothetical protein
MRRWVISTSIDPRGRRRSKDTYRRGGEFIERRYPDQANKVEAIVADPSDPLVLYARTTSLRRPRCGPLLHTTTWTRYVFAPGHQQLREIGPAGVIRVA